MPDYAPASYVAIMSQNSRIAESVSVFATASALPVACTCGAARRRLVATEELGTLRDGLPDRLACHRLRAGLAGSQENARAEPWGGGDTVPFCGTDRHQLPE